MTQTGRRSGYGLRDGSQKGKLERGRRRNENLDPCQVEGPGSGAGEGRGQGRKRR